MSFPKELSEYTDEAELREKFLVPLLQRLGFSVVVNYHGDREFGKDLVFGRIDNFGHVVYYGMQAKRIASLPLSAVSDSRDDVEQAFANPFRHPQTGAEGRISRFYFVNSGSISDAFKQDFFNRIHHHAPNVVVFDGLGLLALEQLAAFSGLFVKETLSGLLFEVRSNRNCSVALEQALPLYLTGGPYPTVRYRLHAVGAFFERPFIPDATFQDQLQGYWHLSRSINDIIDSTDSVINAPDRMQNRISTVLGIIPTVNDLGIQIEQRTAAALRDLGIELPVSFPPSSNFSFGIA